MKSWLVEKELIPLVDKKGTKSYINFALRNFLGFNKTKNFPTFIDYDRLNTLSTSLPTSRLIGFRLREAMLEDIEFLVELKCNRGIRHRSKLPVRGQRTKTNAKTFRRVGIFKQN